MSLLGATTTAAGAQTTVEPPAFEEFGQFLVDRARPDVIILNGPIVESALLDFRRAERAYPDARTLVLNSPGGLVSTGLTIADELHEDGFATIIPSWAGCYSACAFLFLAGVERAAIGELGLHQFYSDSGNLNTAQRTVADILDVLARFGTSSDLISLMLRTPPDEIHVLDAREVERFGVNVGFAEGTADFEFAAVAALAGSRGDTAHAAAWLYVNPDDWREIEGEVDWRVQENDGDVIVAAEIRIGDDELNVNLVLREVFDPITGYALALGITIDDPDYAPIDYEIGSVLITLPRGSDETRRTSFFLAPHDDPADPFLLVGQRRWVLGDLAVLRAADLMVIGLTDGNGEAATLQIQTTNILSSVIDEWMTRATELPIGDLDADEAPQPALVTVGDATEPEEGTATWYAHGAQIGARIFMADRSSWIDVTVSRTYAYIRMEPPSAFAETPVIGLSPFEGVEWVRIEPGVYGAQLGEQAVSRLAVTLARTDAFELELVRADDEHLHIVVETGDHFDTMLDAVLDAWENQPPEEQQVAANPAATAPASTRRPDYTLDPNYGEVTLTGGFRPDPHATRLQAGGPIDAAAALGDSCAGFISDAPDLRIYLTAASADLFLSVLSTSDTTLVVNDPAGNWLCADDNGNSFNPQLRLDRPADGQYDIWVGNRESRALVDATLQIGTRAAVPSDGTTKPMPAAAGDAVDGGPFVDIGFYRDWGVTRNDDTCIAYTVPLSVSPQNAGIDDTFFAIYIARGEREGFPSFIFAFDPDTDYFVTVRIDGGATFDFDPDDNFAYLNRSYDPAVMVQALQNGVAMEAVSVTATGSTRTERYSLLGATAALAAAIAACR